MPSHVHVASRCPRYIQTVYFYKYLVNACVLLNYAGSTVPYFELVFPVIPVIQHGPQVFSSIEGSPISLPCRASGVPNPDITWAKVCDFDNCQKKTVSAIFRCRFIITCFLIRFKLNQCLVVLQLILAGSMLYLCCCSVVLGSRCRCKKGNRPFIGQDTIWFLCIFSTVTSPLMSSRKTVTHDRKNACTSV